MTTTVEYATFTIPGRIAGKYRHRTAVAGGRARTYDDPRNKPVAARIVQAWADHGATLPDDQPLALTVLLFEQRPQHHWTTTGALSAAGRRSIAPTRKPDLDNVAKQICDALNGRLWRDDAQIATLTIQRSWLEDPDEQEYAELVAWTMGEDDQCPGS